MQDFTKLAVWQKSHTLVLDIYRTTELFPKTELFGLTSQIRRASISIPSNIAEGCGREGGADTKRFFQIGFGSACELQYQILLARDLRFITQEQYEQLLQNITGVKKMLASLMNKIAD